MAYCCDVERKKLQNRISRIHGQIHSLKNKFDDEKFKLEEDPYETITPLKNKHKLINLHTAPLDV